MLARRTSSASRASASSPTYTAATTSVAGGGVSNTTAPTTSGGFVAKTASSKTTVNAASPSQGKLDPHVAGEGMQAHAAAAVTNTTAAAEGSSPPQPAALSPADLQSYGFQPNTNRQQQGSKRGSLLVDSNAFHPGTVMSNNNSNPPFGGFIAANGITKVRSVDPCRPATANGRLGRTAANNSHQHHQQQIALSSASHATRDCLAQYNSEMGALRSELANAIAVTHHTPLNTTTASTAAYSAPPAMTTATTNTTTRHPTEVRAAIIHAAERLTTDLANVMRKETHNKMVAFGQQKQQTVAAANAVLTQLAAERGEAIKSSNGVSAFPTSSSSADTIGGGANLNSSSTSGAHHTNANNVSGAKYNAVLSSAAATNRAANALNTEKQTNLFDAAVIKVANDKVQAFVGIRQRHAERAGKTTNTACKLYDDVTPETFEEVRMNEELLLEKYNRHEEKRLRREAEEKAAEERRVEKRKAEIVAAAAAKAEAAKKKAAALATPPALEITAAFVGTHTPSSTNSSSLHTGAFHEGEDGFYPPPSSQTRRNTEVPPPQALTSNTKGGRKGASAAATPATGALADGNKGATATGKKGATAAKPTAKASAAAKKGAAAIGTKSAVAQKNNNATPVVTPADATIPPPAGTAPPTPADQGATTQPAVAVEPQTTAALGGGGGGDGNPLSSRTDPPHHLYTQQHQQATIDTGRNSLMAKRADSLRSDGAFYAVTSSAVLTPAPEEERRGGGMGASASAGALGIGSITTTEYRDHQNGALFSLSGAGAFHYSTVGGGASSSYGGHHGMMGASSAASASPAPAFSPAAAIKAATAQAEINRRSANADPRAVVMSGGGGSGRGGAVSRTTSAAAAAAAAGDATPRTLAHNSHLVNCHEAPSFSSTTSRAATGTKFTTKEAMDLLKLEKRLLARGDSLAAADVQRQYEAVQQRFIESQTAERERSERIREQNAQQKAEKLQAAADSAALATLKFKLTKAKHEAEAAVKAISIAEQHARHHHIAEENALLRHRDHSRFNATTDHSIQMRTAVAPYANRLLLEDGGSGGGGSRRGGGTYNHVSYHSQAQQHQNQGGADPNTASVVDGGVDPAVERGIGSSKQQVGRSDGAFIISAGVMTTPRVVVEAPIMAAQRTVNHHSDDYEEGPTTIPPTITIPISPATPPPQHVVAAMGSRSASAGGGLLLGATSRGNAAVASVANNNKAAGTNINAKTLKPRHIAVGTASSVGVRSASTSAAAVGAMTPATVAMMSVTQSPAVTSIPLGGIGINLTTANYGGNPHISIASPQQTPAHSVTQAPLHQQQQQQRLYTAGASRSPSASPASHSISGGGGVVGSGTTSNSNHNHYYTSPTFSVVGSLRNSRPQTARAAVGSPAAPNGRNNQPYQYGGGTAADLNDASLCGTFRQLAVTGTNFNQTINGANATFNGTVNGFDGAATVGALGGTVISLGSSSGSVPPTTTRESGKGGGGANSSRQQRQNDGQSAAAATGHTRINVGYINPDASSGDQQQQKIASSHAHVPAAGGSPRPHHHQPLIGNATNNAFLDVHRGDSSGGGSHNASVAYSEKTNAPHSANHGTNNNKTTQQVKSAHQQQNAAANANNNHRHQRKSVMTTTATHKTHATTAGGTTSTATTPRQQQQQRPMSAPATRIFKAKEMAVRSDFNNGGAAYMGLSMAASSTTVPNPNAGSSMTSRPTSEAVARQHQPQQAKAMSAAREGIIGNTAEATGDVAPPTAANPLANVAGIIVSQSTSIACDGNTTFARHAATGSGFGPFHALAMSSGAAGASAARSVLGSGCDDVRIAPGYIGRQIRQRDPASLGKGGGAVADDEGENSSLATTSLRATPPPEGHGSTISISNIATNNGKPPLRIRNTTNSTTTRPQSANPRIGLLAARSAMLVVPTSHYSGVGGDVDNDGGNGSTAAGGGLTLSLCDTYANPDGVVLSANLVDTISAARNQPPFAEHPLAFAVPPQERTTSVGALSSPTAFINNDGSGAPLMSDLAASEAASGGGPLIRHLGSHNPTVPVNQQYIKQTRLSLLKAMREQRRLMARNGGGDGDDDDEHHFHDEEDEDDDEAGARNAGMIYSGGDVYYYDEATGIAYPVSSSGGAAAPSQQGTAAAAAPPAANPPAPPTPQANNPNASLASNKPPPILEHQPLYATSISRQASRTASMSAAAEAKRKKELQERQAKEAADRRTLMVALAEGSD